MKRYSMRNPQLITWLGGIAMGAVAMYLADPALGKRRRLLVQERVRTASGQTGSAIDNMMHGAGKRLSALQSQAKTVLRRNALDDEGLQARVKHAVSKLASVPHEISIKAEQGSVILPGIIAAKEKNRLVQKLRRLPGVREVRDHLETRNSERKALFRRKERRDISADISNESGKAVHAAASAGGAAIGAARHLPVGALLAVAGLGYAIKTLGRAKFSAPRSHAIAPRTQAIHLQKSIEIQASPETVFNIWAKYDNFPQFMSHLVEIQTLDAERSHWTMRGPAGVNLEWDAALTKYLEPTMLAWKTEPGSPIEHNGLVRFESSNGGTRVTVRMFYGPAAGRSDSLVALLGNDPERELEEDLLRMKNFIEGKNFPRDFGHASSSSGQVLH